MRKCYIVSAGDFAYDKFLPKPEDYIIAADAGYKYLEEKNVIPNLVVGDFDSYGMVPKIDNVIVYPTHKDDTDTLIAIKEGLKRGFKYFEIFGGLGGRIDHSLANIQALLFLKKQGATGVLVGKQENICVISSETITFSSEAYGNISLISLCKEVKGVTIENFLYNVKDINLTNDFPIGVSNEFVGRQCKISVREGDCAVVFTCGVDFLETNM